jgi:hypothetical protein
MVAGLHRMNPFELNLLHVIHVGSAIGLIAYTFFAFAAPPETRKRVLILTGVASLLIVLTGVRMWQGVYAFAPLAWIFVKIFCWLGLSALTGMAYRKRDKVNLLITVVWVLSIAALVAVYWKPTF